MTVASSKFNKLNILSNSTIYIISTASVTQILPLDIFALAKCFIVVKVAKANIAILKILLPRILLRQRLGLPISSVAEILVNNSGNDVTADNITPPKKAPDNLVVLSSISIYFDALIEKKITKEATTMYSKISNIYYLLFAAITESIYALIFGFGSSQPSGLITLLSFGL